MAKITPLFFCLECKKVVVTYLTTACLTQQLFAKERELRIGGVPAETMAYFFGIL
jgi:hypothetical protein